ncbi:hypothetical protein O1L60_47720 [Streptomyces diastatochromogenes]|nr:hypothetical protein [Streptomyces diastatochromogenes]
MHSTEPYERILLLLTVAMMEMHRIKVWITSDPAYAQTEGFVLARDRAILANWVREDSVWRVATTSAAQDVAPTRRQSATPRPTASSTALPLPPGCRLWPSTSSWTGPGWPPGAVHSARAVSPAC